MWKDKGFDTSIPLIQESHALSNSQRVGLVTANRIAETHKTRIGRFHSFCSSFLANQETSNAQKFDELRILTTTQDNQRTNFVCFIADRNTVAYTSEKCHAAAQSR